MTSRASRRIDFASREFAREKYAHYAWLREHEPVHRGRISVMRCVFVSRYEDCVALLKDPRFVRNRATATGGSRMPFPLPRSVALMSRSMIVEDDPAHRRLRNLVKQAFTPGALERLEARIESLTGELLDGLAHAAGGGPVDLQEAYALPIPTTVIREMVGVSDADMPRFRDCMRAVTSGLGGLAVLRTLFLDLPRASRFARETVRAKRSDPGPDILTALIQAEEEGRALGEDELVSMLFLLIVAGFETTLHLITNGVLALLQHPEQRARLRAEPALLDTAVEEIVRYCGPVHGTKPNWAREDLTLRGVPIARGTAVFPILGAANHDPAAFERPERFDVGRTPNHHLGFGHGSHFCLGARLARMETRIALRNLFERFPDLRLAVAPEELEVAPLPLWHRYRGLPVRLA